MEWTVMDNPKIDDFEHGEINLFEYNLSEETFYDCLTGIKQIAIKDESGQGWQAEYINAIVNDPYEGCVTITYEFDVRFF